YLVSSIALAMGSGGAGVILKTKGEVQGLTTAALIFLNMILGHRQRPVPAGHQRHSAHPRVSD
ncbi:hypothetical protein, partial [Klebsiella variicola]|uniref:hypothetical protein n=1 Tax=Klebsiella variicola TaxID=244366 RepID=UPI0022317C4A